MDYILKEMITEDWDAINIRVPISGNLTTLQEKKKEVETEIGDTEALISMYTDSLAALEAQVVKINGFISSLSS